MRSPNLRQPVARFRTPAAGELAYRRPRVITRRENILSPQEPVTIDSIDRLCTLAQLPLPAERRIPLASMLSDLVAAANELSRKMANAGHQAIVPIVRFPER